ncbi:hypothetical protein SAMN02910358_02419 [Lachnospiraceae bacterium XBB1006]|nr:hypothetical protein SAMN02910358_02419 [Lachnospiraceae bacterium XBB1006]
MDHQPYTPVNQPVTPQTSSMPTAALTLSIIGLIFSFTPFFGLICPSIATTLALLSRGGTMHTEGKSKLALTLGIIGLFIAFCMIIYLFYYLATSVDYNDFYQEFQNKLLENNTTL